MPNEIRGAGAVERDMRLFGQWEGGMLSERRILKVRNEIQDLPRTTLREHSVKNVARPDHS